MAQEKTPSASVPGELFFTNFVSAPFPHPQRAEGHKYKDKFFSAAQNYSDSSVAIYIPAGFRETGSIDCAVHFHGWGSDLRAVLPTYQLLTQLQASGRNAILIVPQGPYKASDSFGGKLEDPDGFKRFMAEAVQVLKQMPAIQRKDVTLGKVILSGHSGGYQVISAILDHGGMEKNIREVWLFDALYAQTDRFLSWCRRQPEGRFIDIYTPHGGTVDETQAMMKTMKGAGDAFVQIDEPKMTLEQLKARRLFIFTTMTHGDVIAKNKTFETFLKTSCLDSRSGL